MPGYVMKHHRGRYINLSRPRDEEIRATHIDPGRSPVFSVRMRIDSVSYRANGAHCRACCYPDGLRNPKNRRSVETISIQDTLARVLKIIDRRDYSQFPVYEDKQFRGLLTENGVTRWLAHHVVKTLSLVELDDIPVAQVLQNEEKRKNYQFVSREMLVDDIRALFAKQALLEAVLITASGKQAEKLLGVATRWDVLHLA